MLDILLTVGLAVFVPAYELWSSLRRKPAAKAPPRRLRTYLGAIVRAALLMSALAAMWIPADRSWNELGLALPLAGKVGLGLAATLLISAALYLAFAKPSKGATPPEVAAMMPSSRKELAGFLGMILVIGPSWEILFRGYLLWSLTPWLGTWPAVAVASLAYGAAHGYRNRGQFIGSLVAALAFTTGYALTGSLWWLILVHTGLPILAVAGMARHRAAAAVASQPA